MAAKRVLKAVPAAKPQRRTTVAKAVASEDRREVLLALRARIARQIDNPKTPAAPLAALIKELHCVTWEIARLDRAATYDD